MSNKQKLPKDAVCIAELKLYVDRNNKAVVAFNASKDVNVAVVADAIIEFANGIKDGTVEPYSA